jgi:hypothetical protein
LRIVGVESEPFEFAAVLRVMVCDGGDAGMTEDADGIACEDCCAELSVSCG